MRAMLQIRCTLMLFAAALMLAATPVLGQEESSAEHADETAESHAADDHGEADHAADEHGAGGHGGGASANPLTLDPDLAIFTALVFLILLAFLTKFAWKPLREALDAREKMIADQIEDARRSAEQAAQQLQQYEARLAAAGEEARAIVAAARSDAAQAAERIRSEAQQAAERERQRAVADITSAKNAALDEMNERSVDLAVLMASRMLRRQLQADDHAQLIRDALEQLPSRN